MGLWEIGVNKVDNKKEYYEDYCMNGAPDLDENTIIKLDEDSDIISWTGTDTMLDIDTSLDLVVEGDVVIKNYGEDSIDVYNTIREQKLQIEALSEMIAEMVEKKDFNIDWDLNKRVEQKRFLQKLSKDA